ncbi:hypothetical protein B296_00043758 [Ensete ventricosum]|uniref:Uncharacterized protein n=1 Tax=Ensete ventricosum TaxID=4639 RepID=A0A426XHW3_ENSVE|nr:hypothetical protein B296_00043758 [Ensete ventricosum]
MIGQSQVQAYGWSKNDAVGNSLGVHQELAKGIKSLPGWHKGVHRKKTKTHWKIIGGLDDVVGTRREFAKTSPKVSGTSLGTY